jgi:hypothetical protein
VERANVRTVRAVAPRAGAHTRGKARSIIRVGFVTHVWQSAEDNTSTNNANVCHWPAEALKRTVQSIESA